MTQYQLTVMNNSSEPWDIFMFQKNPAGQLTNPHLRSLAWFRKYTAPNSVATFTWSLDYSFSWSQTGALIPGVVYSAGQTFPADPFKSGYATAGQAGSWTNFIYHADNDYYEFVKGPGGVPAHASGTLYINVDKSVPNQLAAVGIGMSGAPAFALPALTNILHEFTPQPVYYVAAGTQMKQGQVLIEEVSNAAELDYDGVASLTATFGRDHTWSVGHN
ncbi:hypothetical protein [Phytohabitans houttuyneae]|uniref:Protein RhiA n=1 Tax=Phytohabitans houttuyneae TaxID=1076126 RepID=A0A6V8KQQ7_9ACTN|nr:hypothetical protein [Phytohabitans houttuyneae]GFJ84117.1 hypothetical protein Phou_082970 [Phytohabitans houttuyneae]